MLRLKLARYGKKDRPTWRVVVVERTRTGQGKVTDYVGSYNPHLNPKEFKLDQEKYDHWIGVGAQPTDAVLRLKGKFIDKTKDYQKEVQTKLYKSKKPVEAEEKKEAPKAAAEGETPVEVETKNPSSPEVTKDKEITEEKMEEEIESTTPVEETKEEKVEESQEESIKEENPSSDDTKEEKTEEKSEEKSEDSLEAENATDENTEEKPE